MSERRKSTTTYLSFLVRLWRTDSSGRTWRASLEEVDPAGGRYHFTDLDALFGFLVAAIQPSQDRPDTSAERNRPDDPC